ncbi:MAG: hypothetical protein JJU01_04795 [Alkalibacterium sp.]|nr:hypothetical protein [Alkalibacterium sp.]
MNENQINALEEMLRQKRENEEKIGIKDVTRILYPSNPPEPSPAKQTS